MSDKPVNPLFDRLDRLANDHRIAPARVRPRLSNRIRSLCGSLGVAAIMIGIFAVPALANTETWVGFVYNPAPTVAGSAHGQTFSYPAGLFQFSGGGTGYCIDIATHLERTAYSDGPEIQESHIVYLLNHAFPKGPNVMGDPARESAAVQSAIWYFSDGFNPTAPTAGDIIARSHQLVDDALAHGGALPSGNVITLSAQPADHVNLNASPSHAATVVAHVADGGTGGPAPDGTIVNFTAAGGSLSAASVATTGGNAAVQAIATSIVPSQTVTITAATVTKVPAGSTLIPVTGSQRLITSSFGSREYSASARVVFTASAQPTLAKLVKDLTPAHATSGTDIRAYPGDHLRFELACGNSGLIPTAQGVVSDDLNKNQNMGLLKSVKPFGRSSSSVDAGVLIWTVGPIAPGSGACLVGFEADVPSSLDGATTVLTNCGALNSIGGSVPDVTSNCVKVTVTTVAGVVAVKLVDGHGSSSHKPGDKVTYSITVTNSGNRNLSGVHVTDDVSQGSLAKLTGVTVADGGTFDGGPRLLTWVLPSLASGQSASVSFTAVIPDYPCGTSDTLTNVASVQVPGAQISAQTGAVVTTVTTDHCVAPTPPPPPGQVLGDKLPNTGTDVAQTLLIGMGLMLLALALIASPGLRTA